MTTEAILAALRQRLDRPATLDELLRLLRIGRYERTAFRRQLKRLVANGMLVETRAGRFGLPELMDLVVGRLSMTTGGAGFVEPERGPAGLVSDVFIDGADLNQAMHGDRVLVRVERAGRGQRPAGRILRVLDRATSTVVGRFETDAAGLHFVAPFDRRLTTDVIVPRGETGQARPGAMVVTEIVRWPTPTRGPVGRVVEVLGDADTPGTDVHILLRHHGIPDAHGEAARAEARHLGRVVRPRDIEGRTDFRREVVVTIDGEAARDFDDAVSVERLPGGLLRLSVHIADVAHYVKEDSALDLEARERGTSVYFPDRAVHMFPEDLATGLCSLAPGVDRLVQSCVMDIDRRGEVVSYTLHEGVIRSRARLTYTAVNAMLAQADAALRREHAPLLPMLELMGELFEVLHARRRRRGSIDFDLPEPVVLLNAEGLVENIVASERNLAHRLIEEFMLVANETVARHLLERGWPAVYRVHERPDPLKVGELAAFVRTLGHTLAAPPDRVRPADFQRLLEDVRGRPEERPIAWLVLRTMQKARYDVENLGHFGLATGCYTHFTSPIRRYPDLLVHRALRSLAREQGTPGEARRLERLEQLREWARLASDRERRADEAERELLQWKQVRFMVDKVGEDFDGYVTGVAPFGLFVELAAPFVEGLVHVSTMTDDYYHHHERGHLLEGARTRRCYRLGDRVRIRVLRADPGRRQVDFGLVDILDRVHRSDERFPAGQRRPQGIEAAEEPGDVRECRRERRQAKRHETGGDGGRRRRPGRPGRRERALRALDHAARARNRRGRGGR